MKNSVLFYTLVHRTLRIHYKSSAYEDQMPQVTVPMQEDVSKCRKEKKKKKGK
jgi:hypothetical protein